MKKVLFITYQYPPCASSGVFRTIRFIKYLPDFGWEPIVLSIKQNYYGQGIPFDENLIQENSYLKKIKCYRTKTLPDSDRMIVFYNKYKDHYKVKKTANVANEELKRENISKRIKDIVTLSLTIPDKQNGWVPYAVIQGLDIVKKGKPDILYASGRPWSAFLIGAALKKITGKPLVIDFRDPWVDNPYKEYKYKIFRKINSWLEKYCIKSSNFVVANTEPLRKVFLSKYPDILPNKVITITNGYDDTEFGFLSDNRKDKLKNNSITITHVGSLYSKRNPENFIIALSLLIKKGLINKNKISLKFIGKVKDLDIKKIAEKEGMEEVIKSIGHLPKKEALLQSYESDILLLIQPDTKLQIPAKLFEYIRLKKNIFAICGKGATKDVILANNFGTVADYDNIDDIEKKFYSLFQKLANSRCLENQPAKSKDSKNAFIQFDSKVLTKELATIFSRLAESHSYEEN